MPQGPAHLHERFGDTSGAWKVLDEHYYDDRGMIRRKDAKREITQEEGDAIDYLWLEWDYGFDTE